MNNAAKERRRHVLYLTQNSEYHCRDRECVAVRDRNTRQWQKTHAALRAALLGGLDSRRKLHRCADCGMRLVFAARSPLITSEIIFCGRPDKHAPMAYTSSCWSGKIGKQS